MNCNLSWCSIAIIFFIANIYVAFTTSKSTQKSKLYQVYSRTDIERYEKIVRQRRDIYFTGYALGLVFAIITVFVLINNKYIQNKTSIICIVGAITLLVNYFYYKLTPKNDYMILHLDNLEKRKAWLEIYRTMQVKYHIGLILGVISAMFVAKSIC